MFAKHHRSIFPIKGSQISTPFSLIHSDVWAYPVLPIFLALDGLSPLLMIVPGSHMFIL